MASTRRYWRIITLLPVLLALESLYLSMLNSQERVFDLLLPRFMLLIVIVLLMASVKSTASCRYSKKNTSCSSSSCQRRIM